jgi:glycosyltransferase involved in cell wall biosynthesis
MRIGLVVPGFGAHEADWPIPALKNLVVALARNHEIHVFSLRYPPRREENGPLSFQNLTHHPTGGGQRTGLSSLSIWARTLRAIRRQHRQTPFDILHAFWADEPGLVAGLAGKWLHRPVIVSSAGGEFVYLRDIQYGTSGSHFRRAMVRLGLKLGDVVTAGSRYQEELCLIQRIRAAKVNRLPLGVDTDRFRPVPLPAGPLTLVQAGSLMPVKNQRLLIEILARVRAQIPDAQLLVAGKGPLWATLVQQAERMQIAGAINWLGEIAYPDMPAVYAQAHLYVQTSRHESQGMAVLEAMACGRPVVGTPVGVARELAHLPDIMDPASFAAEIVQLWSNRDLLQRKSDQAAAIVRENYALGQVVDRFHDLYARIGTRL